MLRTLTLSLLAAALLGVHPCDAEEPANGIADEQSLRESMRDYEEAFNRGDAKAVAAHWTENGEYLTISSQRIEGRSAVQAAYEELFKEKKGLKLTATTASLSFVAPNVAVEEGVARITAEGQPPVEARYEVVHVKEGDAWRLSRVREAALPPPPAYREQLEPLAWLVGEWTSSDENATVRTTGEWEKNNSFLTRSFTVAERNRVVLEGMQVIAWDPAVGQIRSWAFDSQGGREEAVWRRDGKRWNVNAIAVLPDGRKASAQRIITPVDDDTFTWKSVGGQADGQLLPNIDEITIVRATDHSAK